MSDIERKLAPSLLALRLGVFIVMLMWTLDKFVNPQHGVAIFEKFYGVSGADAVLMQVLGALELILLLLFVTGSWKTWTYGAVFLLHGVSTLSSWQQYLQPWDHLLFFAAWPMLAACYALFVLRDYDRLLSRS